MTRGYPPVSFLQHALGLGRRLDFSFDIVKTMCEDNAFVYLIRDFAISFLFALRSASAEPGPAPTSTANGPTEDQDGPRSEGLRDQLGS